VNFLAHLLLSGDHPEWIVGGFLGDFVKGRLKGHYPADVEAGIQLHRKIDQFTDQHPLLKECHLLFTPELRRYSSIITDISFDHFLARHWARYNNRELTEFNTLVLAVLKNPSVTLPDNAQLFLERMVSRDLLLQYRLPEVIPRVLQRTAQRLSRPNPLAQSGEQFIEQYDLIEAVFFDFFPELEEFAQIQRIQLASP
jgi:acyl carrier protein phosphodiesterase